MLSQNITFFPGIAVNFAIVYAVCVAQTACCNFQYAHVASVGTEHFRAYIPDFLFYVPDAFARAALAAEQTYVAGIGARVVGAHKA